MATGKAAGQASAAQKPTKNAGNANQGAENAVSEGFDVCTYDKIMKGHYLTQLEQQLRQLGAYYTPDGLDVDTVESAAKKTRDLKSNAYDVVEKIPNYRLPIEQNLLVAILYKAFVKID